MRSSRVAWLLILWMSPGVVWAQGLQSSHGTLRAVPVPQPVRIDGKLDEWDVSAEMFTYGVRRLRDRYSVRFAAMWDVEALYLGLRWRDPTPLINNVDVDASPGDGWMADSFQGRFIVSGRQIHLTTCYSSRKDKTAAVIEYDAALNPAGRRVFLSPGKVIRDDSGFGQAFTSDSDSRGYVQEIRIPWKLLGGSLQPVAGAKIGFTGEYFWGNASGTTWPAVMWSDPINPKNPVRIVVYQNPGVWGELELLGHGHLPRVDEADEERRLTGPLPIRFSIPDDATHFSVVIDDLSGRRIRNLASHQRVEDYLPAASLPPAVGPSRTIEVAWDGRPDGAWNRDRQLFVGEDVVPAGRYTARCVVHRGIGVTYAGSYYNPGAPPWPTSTGSGGWGFDHTAPSAVAAMPRRAKSKGRVFLGWEHGEGGVGFIGLDSDGRKIWEWLRRGAGATTIAASDQHVYFTFRSEGYRLGRVNPDTGRHVEFEGGTLDLELPGAPGGLAVGGNLIAISLPDKGAVEFREASTGRVIRTVKTEAPGAVTLLSDGSVLGIRRGRGLFRIAAGSETAESLVAPDQPCSIAVDSTAQVFLGDSQRANVARMPGVPWNVTGQLAVIADPGGHVPGPWNPQRMGVPVALAVEERDDGTSHLWVAEQQQSPRRVSVWNVATGKLVRDYLGNTRYSGTGGFLSDDVPGIGFVDGVKYRLDPASGDYEPLEILGGAPASIAGQTNAFSLGKGAGNFANPYHFLSTASGREFEYIVEAGGTHPMVFMKRGDRWQCVAALGSASHVPPADQARAPSPSAVFSWHDVNGDGHQQAAEFTWHDLGSRKVFQTGWGYRCGRDLVFYHSGFAFRPVRFTPDGAPVYDVSSARRLPGALGEISGDIHKTRFGYVADLGSGEDIDRQNVVHGLHHVAGFNESGELIWKYPNYWVAVHGAFTAPMAMPGVLMGVLKTTGIVDPADDARTTHSVISLRGNIGQEFLIRDDGIYLAELFTDQRMAPADLPPTRDIVGAPINETTLGGEPFNGWIGRQRDGRVRMTFGQTDVRIAEVVGLDRVADLPPVTLEVGPTEIAVARMFQPRLRAVRPTTADIPAGGAFTDGELAQPQFFSDANGSLIIRSGREELGVARLRWDSSDLHLACQVADPTPLVNLGISGPLAFKSGDSVSLYASPLDAAKPQQIGGTRVLFTILNQKPVTMVYRPQGPGTAPYTFESPVRKSAFQYVAPSQEIPFHAQTGQGSYTLRASVPWSELGISPARGLQLSGDLGLLFGGATGSVTAERIHWVDRETNVVNDVPTEAEFFPERWGVWTLVSSELSRAPDPAPPRHALEAAADRTWKTVYRETFDQLSVGLKTTEGALAHWDGGSALGLVRDGGPASSSGRYLGQVTAWQHFNFGPVLNLNLEPHPHTHVRVRFNLYTFGDWHGDHGAGSPHALSVFDPRATHPFSRTFSLATVAGAKQSWPDPLSKAVHPAVTGATRDDSIDTSPTHLNDHRWPVSFEYVSGSNSLRFALLSAWHSLGGPPMPEPAFGIDDVHVEVLNARIPPAGGAGMGVSSAPEFRWSGVVSPGAQDRADLKFTLDQPGYVTLAIDDAAGTRVRNLIGETPFSAGEHTVTWDGRDETCRNFRICGVYDLDPQPLPPGHYQVRGLVRPAIEARYELCVNNSGNPPWFLQDGTGRWLADHSPPSDVLFLPPGRVRHPGQVRDAGYRPGESEFISAEEPLMLIASHVAESGDGLVWCNLEGIKRRGVRSLGAGGGWCGAERLACDSGAGADTSVYAYAATGWKNTLELRTLPDGAVIHSATLPTPGDLNCVGLAVHNRLLAVAVRPVETLFLFDTVAKKQICTVPLEQIGGTAFDEHGRLYVVTRKQILRWDNLVVGHIGVDPQGRLDPRHQPVPVVRDGLDDPRQLLVDRDELFVADHGSAHQIKVYGLQGERRRVIGQPGGARLGGYQQEAMQSPAGMSIDSKNRLWVAESDYSPKRVSVWSREGRFERAFYGPPGYGGGGSLDPADPTRFRLAYGSGLEFQIDWQTRRSVPVHRYWLEKPETLRLGGDWHAAPQTSILVDGRTYLTNGFSNSPGGFGNVVGIWRLENGIAVPAAAAGAFSDWPPLQTPEFQKRAPADADRRRVFFAWSDLNDDQKPQPDEVTTAVDDGIQHNNGKHVGGIYVTPELGLVSAYGLQCNPIRYSPRGVPIYDATSVTRLASRLEFHWVPYDAVTTSDGWFITRAEPLRGFRNGKQVWSYPNRWPELHACLREPPPLPSAGQFIGAMRWLGHPVRPVGSDVGDIFALTGYYGRISLITSDGLCVGSLFQDARATGYFNAFEKLGPAEPGLLMNDASLQTECFFDTITQTRDGRIYLQAGKSQCTIVRLDGLNAIRRIPDYKFELR